MYSVVLRVRTNATIQYSSFMDIYEFVTAIEFILLMFIVPAVTAASISGERERQTLDLMLTTQMTAAQIVTGKLMGALSSLFVLILSSFSCGSHGVCLWRHYLVGCSVTDLLLCGSGFYGGKSWDLLFIRIPKIHGFYGCNIRHSDRFCGRNVFYQPFCPLSMSAANLDQTIAVYAMEAPAIRASSGGAFYLF